MIGYHFTSYENWKTINRQGLLLADLGSDFRKAVARLTDRLPSSFKGVWIWTRPQRGRSLLGNIVRVIALQNTERVVLLQIEYDRADRFRVDGRPIVVTHKSSIQNFSYRTPTNADCVVLGKPIPPSRIHKIRSWNMRHLINQ